jgi:chorismate mutase
MNARPDSAARRDAGGEPTAEDAEHAGTRHGVGNNIASPDDPTGPDDIAALRDEIDHLDAEILRLIQRRSEVSKLVGAARMASGGPRVVYSREMAILARYRELGPEGRELAMLLLRLGRGRLGR